MLCRRYIFYENIMYLCTSNCKTSLKFPIMKKSILLVSFLVILTALFAENSKPFTVKENSYQKIVISFAIDGLKAEQTGDYVSLTAQDYALSREVGKPALPLLVKMIEIPLCENVNVKYTLSDAANLNFALISPENQIIPAQPSYSKSYKGERKFEKDIETYSKNEFYSLEPVRLEQNGVLRNINLATLYISPVKYNPVTGEVVVYNNIDVEITFEGADIAATQEMKNLHKSRYFASDRVVINPFKNDSKDNYSAPVKYLIVSHSMFKGQFDDFVNWKKRKGFMVEVAYTDEANVGTTYNSIASFIKSKYTEATPENPAPTFVLLIGDVAQIPTKNISQGWFDSHPTDLYYFDWTGNGQPDCFYGRFSAATEAHLLPQVEKTLMYEQMTMPDPSYLDHAILIAGIDSYGHGYTHGNPTIKYAAEYYLNEANGYTTVDMYTNPHASTATATIRNNICQGAGIINYTAHGDVTEWSDPAFKASDITSMTNTNKYGLMIGNCCLSNKFDETSLGESLLRADKKGAVGYIGGSNSTYWDEDVYWSVGARSTISSSTTSPTTFVYEAENLGAYDRACHTHNEPFSEWMTTFGGMIMAGNMAVQASVTDDESKTYYWEIYHLIGDPSVMTWFSQPETMILTADPVSLPVTSVKVHAVPYAYVAITNDLELVAAAFADDNGEATLTFDAIEDLSKVEVAASAQNYKTAFTTLVTQGVNDNETAALYSVRPNPAYDFIEVTAPANEELRLFDVNGRWLGSYVADGETTKIDISSLAPGFYFVKAGKTTIKFIKK